MASRSRRLGVLRPLAFYWTLTCLIMLARTCDSPIWKPNRGSFSHRPIRTGGSIALSPGFPGSVVQDRNRDTLRESKGKGGGGLGVLFFAFTCAAQYSHCVCQPKLPKVLNHHKEQSTKVVTSNPSKKKRKIFLRPTSVQPSKHVLSRLEWPPCFFPGRSRREAAGGKCCVNRSNCLRSHLFTSNAAKNTQSNSTLGRDETLREPLADGCSCPEVADTHRKP